MPATTTTTSTTVITKSNATSSSSVLTRFPAWLASTLTHLSTWVFWPLVGGVMFGVGELSARELLARKMHWGVAPSADAAVARARVLEMRRWDAETTATGTVVQGSADRRR
ncbi:hypothetical protein BC828DRAFT_417284 [Blastocladiella britannica]|nr:hypothetical protein BC828DRAFT_417284 [Blastocladiella britannica]